LAHIEHYSVSLELAISLSLSFCSKQAIISESYHFGVLFKLRETTSVMTHVAGRATVKTTSPLIKTTVKRTVRPLLSTADPLFRQFLGM